jgi:hypothetical protein
VAGSVAKTDWYVRRSYASALYAATPNIWLITRFCARTCFLAIPLTLAFTEHVHSFIALDDPLCHRKHPTPPPQIHAAFHQSMILFHPIVETLDLADDDHCAVFLVVPSDGGRIGLAPIDSDLLGGAMATNRLGEEAIGGLLVALLRAEKTDGLTGPIAA